MRLWSIHPEYLDAKGLVALWREALLARAVLHGRTIGYRHHPQLERFRAHAMPRAAIRAYLVAALDESLARGYAFDRGKVGRRTPCAPLEVTTGQLACEWQHLLAKLRLRDPDRWRAARQVEAPRAHPQFTVVEGPVAEWERASRTDRSTRGR